jgi:hypothetical protein
MSYSIAYRSSDGRIIDKRSPTYNVTGLFAASLAQTGIQSLHGLHGMCGKDASLTIHIALSWMLRVEDRAQIPLLEPLNGWGDAHTVIEVYQWLLKCCTDEPEGMIDTDYGRGMRLVYTPEE